MKSDWPADHVERRAIEALIPYANNARTHSDAQVAQIAASMKEWGWTNPILVDETGLIIAGHGRVMAARKLGLTEAPVMVAKGWTEAQKKAYVLADNQLALNAGWNAELLSTELKGLDASGFDLTLLGFGDLGALLADKTEGLTDPDEAPPLPETPITLAGDVWLLGSHRIICGDSTDAETVKALMNGKNANVCLTDPPYGLGDTKSSKNDYDTHVDSREGLVDLIAGFLPIARQIAPVVVLTPGTMNHRLYPAPTWTMAWFTPAGTGNGPWGFCCWQPILCFGKDPKLARGKGSHPDAIVHTEASQKSIHPCAKPINFWCWLMERVSEQGEAIYEPFSGSGTTIIAAEMTGRRCLAIELSPAYVDVAVLRWEAFTGQTATLDGNGRTFAELSAERLPMKAA